MKQLKPAIRPGSLVIDATVPLATEVSAALIAPWGRRGGGWETAELGARGIGSSSVPQSSHIAEQRQPTGCDVLVCSDDANATQVVRSLAARIPDIRAIDGGKLENAASGPSRSVGRLNIRHKGDSNRITGLPSGYMRPASPPAT